MSEVHAPSGAAGCPIFRKHHGRSVAVCKVSMVFRLAGAGADG